jgi:hypothetical protein
MKVIQAFALLAAFGLFVAACGSGTKVGSRTTTKIARFTKVKGGTVIRCPGGGPTAAVPNGPTIVAGSSYLITAKGSSHSGSFRATRSKSGTLTVSCTR